MTNREKWLQEAAQGKSKRDASLLRRAADILEDNILRDGEYPWGNLRGIVPSKSTYAGVWNWDSAWHAMAVSRWDPELGYEQCALFFDTQQEDGMLIDVRMADGTIGDGASKPPVFPWAFCCVYERQPDLEMLKRAYGVYTKMEGYWTAKRKTGPLFHYDAAYDDGHVDQYAKCESGWDTSVRFDDGVTNLWAIDLNCYMVTVYRSLAFMAKEQGLDACLWEQKERELVSAIKSHMWNEKMGCYTDCRADTHTCSDVLSPASFMPLFIGIATAEQAEKMAKVCADPEKFFPGMPTVSYDHPRYSQSDYWRGPVWLNVAYFALKGLKDYGHEEVADAIRQQLLDWCAEEKRGIYEYYDSKTGEGLGAHNFGWSCAFIIELILNF